MVDARREPTARRSSARASPLTQGSPLCGSRMCPWLRCVDLLAVAACSTPRFYSERAKSPAWTFLPSPPLLPLSPLLRLRTRSYARQTLHSLADSRLSSPPDSSDSYFTPGSTMCSRSLSRIISLVDGNGWKPRGNLTFRGNAREAFLRARPWRFPRRITNESSSTNVLHAVCLCTRRNLSPRFDHGTVEIVRRRTCLAFPIAY